MAFSGRIYVGTDGSGERLKDSITRYLRGRGFEVEDMGTGKYYEAAEAVARAVQVCRDYRALLGMFQACVCDYPSC